MKNQLSAEQIKFYQDNGYIVIDGFLSPDELETWRKSVTNAVRERGGQKMPGKDIKTGEDDGINKDADYFGKVFDQLLNLWQTNDEVKKLMLDERLGKMAAQPDHFLANVRTVCKVRHFLGESCRINFYNLSSTV